MKKFLCLLLVIVMSIAFVACGEEPEPDPAVQAETDLLVAYSVYCSGDGADEFARMGYDGKSVIIDTIPDDDGYFKYEDEAYSAIISINSYIGIPSSVLEKMSNTRALDGMQSQRCGYYTVTWSYHPDSGMEVFYEVN